MYECDHPDCDRVFDTQRGSSLHFSRTHDENNGRVEKQCDECGQMFEVPRTKKDSVYRCSRECRDAGGNAGYSNVTRDCPVCGTSVTVPTNQAERTEHSFCDRECFGEFHGERFSGENHPNWVDKHEKPCVWCGEIVELTQKQISDGRRFCSPECSASWQSHEYSIDYGSRKLANHLRRFYGDSTWRNISGNHRGDTCESCGGDNGNIGLDVHHTVPLRFCGVNSSWNLMSVCSSCHARFERYAEQIFRETFDLSVEL